MKFRKTSCWKKLSDFLRKKWEFFLGFLGDFPIDLFFHYRDRNEIH